MKDLKINAPEGYEIDKEKSTFENIVFKEISKLPSSWKDLDLTSGYYCDYYSYIISLEEGEIGEELKCLFKTKEQAEASTALAQLSQLRDAYRQGWEPDWGDDKEKYTIVWWINEIEITRHSSTNSFLSFQDRKTTKLFLENFRDLIEKAKPLMS